MLSICAVALFTSAPQPPDTASYQVQVTGEVRYPGRVTLTSATMTVADALAAVGSQTLNAGDDVIVIRPPANGEPAQARVLKRSEIDLGAAGLDLALLDGDIVNVPMGKRFFMSGFVKRPGAYRLLPGMTVAQAIIMVGGLDGGNDRRIKAGRIVNGKQVEVSMTLDAIVLPDDVIKVPRRMF